MHAAFVLPRTRANVDAEIAYWGVLHADGHLGGYAFDHDARVPTLGYAIYLANPQASEARLYRVLQDADYRSQSTLSVPWCQARWTVRDAWRHLQRAGTKH
ncbi:hypothetical protein FHR51_000666 [Xanthomonas arboricola]|uniref:hypothetical protein n=1 Tax=Xanthomonas cannabis TaxID=1885674 RepID=UPI00161D5394|nr:hypothetical protein [Xanthomonas cannabis]MBB3804555.1 hypothetical protein [Xanthomonas cannabis]